MATVSEICDYFRALEDRIEKLEAAPSNNPLRIAMGDGQQLVGGGPPQDTVRINIGFEPSQVVVAGAQYNPNMSGGGWVQFQSIGDPLQFIWIAKG